MLRWRPPGRDTRGYPMAAIAKAQDIGPGRRRRSAAAVVAVGIGVWPPGWRNALTRRDHLVHSQARRSYHRVPVPRSALTGADAHGTPRQSKTTRCGDIQGRQCPTSFYAAMGYIPMIRPTAATRAQLGQPHPHRTRGGTTRHRRPVQPRHRQPPVHLPRHRQDPPRSRFTKLDVINRAQLVALATRATTETHPAAAEPKTQPAGRAPRRGGCHRTRAAWGTKQQAGRGSRGHHACRHMGGYRTT